MKIIKISILLCCVILLTTSNDFTYNVSGEENEETAMEEFFSVGSCTFNYTNEKGTVKSDTIPNAFKEGNEGIVIHRTAPGKLRVTIDGQDNEYFKKYQPVFIWIHKADAINDPVYFGDKPDSYYDNKLKDTIVLYTIPEGQYQLDFEVRVPREINMNLSINGMLNGDYYDIEFFTADAIPSQLKFAYEIQSYTVEELEKYINNEMNGYIENYYDIDTGFRSDKDGFTFHNLDYKDGIGVCSGISAVTIAKFINEELDIDSDYITTTWYDCLNGSKSIRDITLNNNLLIQANSPCYSPLKLPDRDGLYAYSFTNQYFPNEDHSDYNAQDDGFIQLLQDYKTDNNLTVVKEFGNYYLGNFRIKFEPYNWNMIELVLAELREGKPVIVNVGMSGGGHSVVGYKFQRIDEDTYRLYCYDSNYPDDMRRYSLSGDTKEKYKKIFENYTGEYSDELKDNELWLKEENDIYIEFTKYEEVYYNDYTKNKSTVSKFKFDTSKLSIKCTDENGSLTFTTLDGDDIDVISVKKNDARTEVVSYQTYAITPEEGSNEIEIRTYAFYKSGKVKEITNDPSTVLTMDMAYVGDYTLDGSKLILHENFVYDSNGTDYVDCYVTYSNGDTTNNKCRVRIRVNEK